MALTNWGGTYRYLADEIQMPASVDELAGILGSSSAVRVAGTRHTFSGITDASTIVSVAGLGERFDVDPTAATVTIDGAMTYGRLAELLAPRGLALQNLASLAHISIAGAVATGTHGSGNTNGCLATAVAAIELVTPTGDVATAARGDESFDAMVVGLGGFGVVTALTLDVRPAFDMHQRIYEHVGFDEFTAELDAVFASAYSVSAFTNWVDDIDQVWIKHRVGDDLALPAVLTAAREATEARHPVIGWDASACTEQGGVVGPWSERLPHFKFDATPSAGAEIQSEYFVPRSAATEAMAAMRSIGQQLAPALLAAEIRTVAGDGLWLSMCHARDSLVFHFTWQPDEAQARSAAAAVEQALRPFEPRPHWGKLFSAGFSRTFGGDRRDEAAALMREMDPAGKLCNDWMRTEGFS